MRISSPSFKCLQSNVLELIGMLVFQLSAKKITNVVQKLLEKWHVTVAPAFVTSSCVFVAKISFFVTSINYRL